MLAWILVIIGAYLLGSIPFGLLLGLSRGVDIRRAGSGNVGATNVSRLLGRPWGVLCFVLDAGKGAVSVVLAGLITGVWGRPLAAVAPGATPVQPEELWLWLAVAAAALLGHMSSPWLRFRGGKGVATGFGAMLAMWPLLTGPAVLALAVWSTVVLSTRYVSVASMSAALSLPIGCVLAALLLGAGGNETTTAHLLRAGAPMIMATSALALLVLYKHRQNLARLRAGTEPRIGGGRRID